MRRMKLIWRIVSTLACLAFVAGCGLGKLEQKEGTVVPTPIVTSAATSDIPGAPPSVTPIATTVPTIAPVTGTVNTEALHVRSGPGVAYDVIGYLSEGDEVRIVSENTDASWLRITYKGGWVKAKFVEVKHD